MRFKDSPQLLGAGRARAWHHHGSHTPTSSRSILLCHTKHFRRQCTSRKSLLCKNGHKFCSITICNFISKINNETFETLDVQAQVYKNELNKLIYLPTSKRVRPHFVGLSTMYGRWMDESYSYRTQDQTTDSGLTYPLSICI